MAGVVGSDGKRGAADTGWNVAQPSCGMAAGSSKRTIIGGSLKVFYGVRPGTMWTQLWRFGDRRAQRAEIFGTLLDTLDTDFSRFRTPPRTDFSPGRTKNHNYKSYL